ncbi:D-alanyl-D-alanine carboxypeptidase/D-alanyl-D-alanine endopeptidase [Stigmatella aurantiaca]|uniref:D-alanyl-D-alanine carboxypeptidase/D-alanyl-D-alanine-endopeptidase n=4 Tax=Stigmatella aurantiaca TaxID=41 RepID=E3FFD3_STIAD|nr:D-alanyl-D-alanine carboxypeptidase/D-alanyl-D-alanine-endopeptidase [Stigmatella aurantiaca]ADO72690.1 D-alanyl-D-alanine carboxypeptidase/D-alanyl-D-alanine-endopeptidase [Stigmatella aurantiaca DW4/3-1]
MRRAPLATLLLAVLALPACVHTRRPARPTLPAVAQELLAAIEQEGALAGALVVDAQTGRALFAHRERVRLLPASTMKLVSTSSALATLGPDFRFVTPVLLEGTHQGALFEGDVVVVSSGDPSLGSWRFPETVPVCEQISEALWGRGIRQWRGALRVESSEVDFDGPLGPGWAWDDAAYAMSAPPTPFVFRENVVDLALTRPEGTACAEPPAVQVSPPFATFPTTLQLDTSATKPGLSCVRARNAPGVRCVWRSSSDQCPRAASLRLSIDDPQALFTACVEDALSRKGLTRLPARSPSAPPPPQTRQSLLELISPPLSELVKATNKESLNLYADRLGLRFARERTGHEGFSALRTALAEELARRGISPREMRPVDGSGLSRYNLATAQGLVQVLFTSLKEPYGAALSDSLPIAGVDGTLANRRLSAQTLGRIRAKTGTLSSQKAFAGIAERPGDLEHPRVVFALMLGNMDEQPALSANDVFDRFAEALVNLPLQ